MVGSCRAAVDKPELLKDKINYEVMGANEWKHAPSYSEWEWIYECVKLRSAPDIRHYADARATTWAESESKP